MVDAALEDLTTVREINKVEQPNHKRNKLLECVRVGNSELYLGKIYTEERINKLSDEIVAMLFSRYESKLSAKMVKSLGKSIINIYSNTVCAVLNMKNQQDLSNDLGEDPFLNSALQHLTCALYYKFGSYLAPISVGMITGRHYVKSISSGDELTQKIPIPIAIL